MLHRTAVIVRDATCQQAVEAYAAELRKAGLQVEAREAAPDVELADEAGEHTLCIEWAESPAAGLSAQCPREDWEDEDDDSYGCGGPADGPTAASRIVSHYVQTFEVLGRDVATAAALLERVGAARHTRGPARGRT